MVLSEHQEQKRKRLLVVQSLLSEGKPNQEIIGILKKEHGLSDAQANRAKQEAIALYGDLRKAEKEGMRYIIYDMAVQTFNKAKMVNRIGEMNKAITNMYKILRLDQEDIELPDFEKLKPSINVVVLDSAIESGVKELFTKGPIDLDELRKKKAAMEVEQVEAGMKWIEMEQKDRAIVEGQRNAFSQNKDNEPE